MQNLTTSNESTFHIGLTMAGAASAGCYTAGVMDYMFEILDLWESAKKTAPANWTEEECKLIPKHNVVIDVMGGCSAGGMTTIMAAIHALRNGQKKPVTDPQVKGQPQGNIFYDSWVLMGDKGNGTKKLFEKTLGTDDLNASKKIQSLLNSDFIDAICDEAFAMATKESTVPSYISPGLEVILSHTMLRSVPLAVDFIPKIAQRRPNKNLPESNTFDHFMVSHFKLNHDPAKDTGHYLPLKPAGAEAQMMKLVTKATGAFPIGLRFREFFNDEFTSEYIRNTVKRNVFERITDTPSPDTMSFGKNLANPFSFVSIDGGAINNEPFGEVLEVLKKAHGKKGDGDYKYALIMIDPFPDLVSKDEYKQPDDLFSVIPKIIGTLWNQAKVKRAEMLDAYSSDYFRSEIFPARYVGRQRQDHAIACGAAMAFSGFLDIDFRHHDFFLGRDNAKNFFRTYFTLEYRKNVKGKPDIIHPIHASWSDDMVNMFKKPGDDENETVFLPIIPDLNYLREKLDDTYKGPFHHSIPEWPVYNPQKIFELEGAMKKRVLKIIELAYEKTNPPKKGTRKERKQKRKEEALKDPVTKAWIKSHYRSNVFKKAGAWIMGKLLGIGFRLSKNAIAGRVTKSAITWILKDLEAKKLLQPKQ